MAFKIFGDPSNIADTALFNPDSALFGDAIARGSSEALWYALRNQSGEHVSSLQIAGPPSAVAYPVEGETRLASIDALSSLTTHDADAAGVTQPLPADQAAMGAVPHGPIALDISNSGPAATGTLWFAGYGGDQSSNYQIGTVGLNGSDHIVSNSSGLDPQDVVVDPTNGLYFAVFDNVQTGNPASEYFELASGSTTSGAFIQTAEVPASSKVADPDNDNNFAVRDLAIDKTDKLVFASVAGPQDADEGVYEFSYSSTGALTDKGFVVLDAPGGLQDPRGEYYDSATSTLYVVDSTPSSSAVEFDDATNGVWAYSVAANGTLGSGTLLTSNSQFITGGGGYQDGIITAVVSNNKTAAAGGYIYFVTEDDKDANNQANGANAQDTVWYINKGAGSGAAAVQLGNLPAGSLTYPGFGGGIPAGLAYDPVGNALYVSDDGTGEVVQIQLNAAGTAATSVNKDYFGLEPGYRTGQVPRGADTFGLTFVDGPAITLGASAKSYSAEASAVTLQGGLTLSDPNGANIASAVVTLTGGYSGDGDVLSVSGSTSGFSVAVSASGATETLTISGTGTAAQYQTLLNEVQFATTTTDPTNAGANSTRTVSVTAYDNAAVGQGSTTETLTITSLAKPVLSNVSESGQEAVQGGGARTLLTGAPTVTSGASITGATVVITNANAGDRLSFTPQGNVSGSYAFNSGNGTGTLTLSGSDSAGTYAAALATVVYQDNGTDTTTVGHATRTIDISLSNAAGASTVVVDTVTLDRAPVATTHTMDLAEGGSSSASSAIDGDPDGDMLMVSSLSGGAVGSAVAGTYGTLTLNSNDTYSYAASNTAAIDAAATGSHPTDSFTYQVSDGYGGVSNETLDFVIDRAPVVSAGAAVGYTEGAPGAPVDGSLTLSDPDGDAIASASVSISAGFASGDALSVVDANGVTGSYNSGTGVLTLSGSASTGAYQALIDSIAFSTSAETVAAHAAAAGADTSRTITYVAGDATLDSAAQTSTVDVGVVIADTAANISNDIDTLNGDATLSAIQIIDGQALTLTAAQFAGDSHALGLVAGAHDVTVSGVTGEGYTGFTADYDANDLLTSETFTGYSGRFYSYATVTYDAAGQVTGATYYDAGAQVVDTLVQTNNPDGSYVRASSGFSGRPYTELTADYDSSGHLTSKTLSGYTKFAYTSVTQDFDASGALTSETFAGYDGAFASITEVFDGSGRISTQAYDDGSNHLLQLLTRSYNSDSSYSITASDVAAGFAGYTGFVKDYSSAGVLQASTVYNDGGIETDRAYVSGLTLTSDANPQNQYAVDGDTFVIGAGSGPDRIHGYTGGNETFDISSSLFPDFATLMKHAQDDGKGDTRIADGRGDSFTLAGVTTAELAQDGGDFHFVSGAQTGVSRPSSAGVDVHAAGAAFEPAAALALRQAAAAFGVGPAAALEHPTRTIGASRDPFGLMTHSIGFRHAAGL